MERFFKKIKDVSIKFTFIVSYSVLLLSIIFSYIFLYRNSISVVENEIDINRVNSLKRFKEDIDNLLYYNYELENYLNMDDKVKSLGDSKAYSNMPYVNDLLLGISRDLYKSTLKLTDPVNIFVYFPMAEKCVKSTGIKSIDTVWRDNFEGAGAKKDEWLETIGNSDENIVSLNMKIGYGEKMRKSLIFKYLLHNDEEKPFCSLIFCIPEETIESIMTKCNIPNDSELCFLNKNGKIILNTGKEKYNIDLKELPVADGRTWEQKSNDESVIGLSFKSSVKNFQYISFLSKQVYYEELYFQRNVIVTTLFIILLFSTVILYSFYKVQSKNWHSIISELDSTEENMSEYLKVKNGVKSLREFQDITNEVLRDSLFLKLFTGKLDLETVGKEVLKTFKIEFQNEYFAVIGFKVVKSGEVQNNLRIIRSLIYILPEYLEPDFSVEYTFDDGEAVYAVFNLSGDELQSFAQKCINGLNDMLRDNDSSQDYSYIAALSNCYRGKDALLFAQKDIANIFEYNLNNPDDMAYTLNMMHSMIKNQRAYSYSANDEQRILNTIMTGDVQKAKKEFADTFDKSTQGVFKSMLIMRQVSFDFSTTLLKAYENIVGGDSQEYRRMLADKNLLITNTDDIREFFLREVESLCSKVETADGESEIRLVDRIDKFLQENYATHTLAIQDIAEEFNKNSQYLARLYIREKQRKIWDTLTELRIEKAKALLKEANKSVDEISSEVGYPNIRTFYRVFKKICGVTPAEYRKSAKI